MQDDMSEGLAGEIVAAVAAGAGKSLVTESAQALSRLIGALRERFRAEPQAQGALERALADPDDAQARQQLVELLQAQMQRDPSAPAWFEELWAATGEPGRADQSRNANLVQGTVEGNVVQGRDISGGIRFG